MKEREGVQDGERESMSEEGGCARQRESVSEGEGVQERESVSEGEGGCE